MFSGMIVGHSLEAAVASSWNANMIVTKKKLDDGILKFFCISHLALPPASIKLVKQRHKCFQVSTNKT